MTYWEIVALATVALLLVGSVLIAFIAPRLSNHGDTRLHPVLTLRTTALLALSLAVIVGLTYLQYRGAAGGNVFGALLPTVTLLLFLLGTAVYKARNRQHQGR